MHIRGRPLFKTKVKGEDLQAAVKDFWLELNPKKYTNAMTSINIKKK